MPELTACGVGSRGLSGTFLRGTDCGGGGGISKDSDL